MKTYSYKKLFKEIRSEFKGQCKIHIKKESYPHKTIFNLSINDNKTKNYVIDTNLIGFEFNSIKYKELKDILVDFIKTEVKHQNK